MMAKSTTPLESTEDRFRSLSLADLIEAREAYHVHLAHHPNVVATAIGRYRIRRTELDRADGAYAASRKGSRSTERTLANSVVRPYSWPAVLVFVRNWVEPEHFRAAPDQALPKRLYLPDGRVVPVCVICVRPSDDADDLSSNPKFSARVMGGGVAIFAGRQGSTQLGTVGCLVSDGAQVYALTSRHIAAVPGEPIYTIANGERISIGVVAAGGVGAIPFGSAYPEWPSPRASVNVDAGLIRVDRLDCWTSQVFGVGPIGDPIDLDTHTTSLKLIGSKVRGYGGASGGLVGEIQALFYRYRTVGGTDFVADLLIGPRSEIEPLLTRPGDSGALWFCDIADDDVSTPTSRPVGLQWGGHRIMTGTGEREYRFALATNLSTVRRLLEVEVVRSHGPGLPEYWGTVGHYTVGARACELCSTPKLDALMRANQARISYPDSSISQGDAALHATNNFSALADVADQVWRTTRGRIKEGSQHFADMDLPGTGNKHPQFQGKSLLDLCNASTKNVDTRVWSKFYDDVGESDPAHRGSLPFRVWFLFEECVRFLKAKKVAEFICAAGTMAHYLGDACQPLHVSRYHHGRNSHESAVHEDYETTMLNVNAPDLLAKVRAALGTATAKPGVTSGFEAARETVRLMTDTVQKLPPLDVVEVWAGKTGSRIPRMWTKLGKRTAERIADGALTLAMLWESAWKLGDGKAIPSASLVTVEKQVLSALYTPDSFLASRTLDTMVSDGFGFAP